MEKYSIDKINKTIKFSDNTSIVFDDIIYDSFYHNNILITTIRPNREKVGIDNVYGVDVLQKKIIWRIKNPRRDVYEIKTLTGYSYNAVSCHFTDTNLNSEGKVQVRSLCNFAAIIDELTGEIKEIRQLKEFK